jgi:hypothetical protein
MGGESRSFFSNSDDGLFVVTAVEDVIIYPAIWSGKFTTFRQQVDECHTPNEGVKS